MTGSSLAFATSTRTALPRESVEGGRGARPIEGSAVFSACGLHRQRLDRWWSDEPRALVCGANPSTAGADEPDATIHRLIALLSWRPGLGGFTMMNADDFVATDPIACARWRDGLPIDLLRAIRAANLARIREVSATAAIRIVAFGNLVPPGLHHDRVLAAMSLDGRHPLYAFGLTGNGAPKHPLARGHHRIPNDAPLVLWRPATIDTTPPDRAGIVEGGAAQGASPSEVGR